MAVFHSTFTNLLQNYNRTRTQPLTLSFVTFHMFCLDFGSTAIVYDPWNDNYCVNHTPKLIPATRWFYRIIASVKIVGVILQFCLWFYFYSLNGASLTFRWLPNCIWFNRKTLENLFLLLLLRFSYSSSSDNDTVLSMQLLIWFDKLNQK